MVDYNPFSPPAATESPCLEHVLYFCWEREAIRIAREQENPAPWTTDPILQKYRFCNIRRRDDRVSKWIIENMLIPATYADDTDIWFIAAIARYINWPPMLAKLLEEGLVPQRVEDFTPVAFGECVDSVTRAGGKAWTGAFMTFPCKVIPGQPKGAATAQHILAPLKQKAEQIREAVASKRVENVVNSLAGGYGWQVFMSGQVAADLSYVYDFDDVNTWAPIGPGSSRGLNRLYGRKLEAKWDQDEFNKALLFAWKAIREELDITDLTLHDVQNCMCEIDKYWRTLNNEGRPRSTYRPETAF